MSEVVEPDAAEAGLAEERGEGPGEVGRVDRSSMRCGEHMPVGLPGVVCGLALALLLFVVMLQRLDAGDGEGDAAFGGPGPAGQRGEPACAGALQCAADGSDVPIVPDHDRRGGPRPALPEGSMPGAPGHPMVGIPAHDARHAVVTGDVLPEEVGWLIVVVATVKRGSHPSPGRDARRPNGDRSEPVQAGLMKVILVAATTRVNARDAPIHGMGVGSPDGGGLWPWSMISPRSPSARPSPT